MATTNVKKEIITMILVSILLIAVAFYLALSVFWSLSTTEARSIVQDSTEQAANIIHNRLESRIDFITTLSRMPFMRLESSSLTAKLAAFDGVTDLHHLTSLGIANANGMYVNTAGERFDISFRDDFKNAMKGNVVISTLPSSGKYVNKPTVCYLVPLYNANNVQYGVFGAQDETLSLARLLFAIKPFKGQAQHLLLNSRGTYQDENAPGITQDFFAFLQSENPPQLVEEIRQGLKSDTLIMTHIMDEGQRHCMGIAQVSGTPSLYVVTLVPDTVSHYQGTAAYIFLFVVFLLLVCSIVSVGRYILILRRKSLNRDTVMTVATAQLGYFTLECDRDNKITACSDNFTEKFLHPGDSPLGLNCFALISDYSDDTVAQVSDESGTFETSITTVDNKVVPVQWLMISNPGTGCNTLIGFDLTPKLEEQKAKASMSKAQTMQNIFDCVPIPMALKDLDERVIMANAAYVNMLHSTLTEVIGKTPQEIYAMGAMEDLTRIFYKSIAQKAPSSIIKNIPHPNGESYLCYRCSQVPMLDECGTVNSVLAVSIDLTDSMRSQEQLAREVGRLQSLFNQSPVGVIVVVEEKVCFINARAREMTSVTMEDNVWDALHCLDKKHAILDDLSLYGTSYNFEISTQNSQGVAREIIATAATTRYNEFPAVVVWTIDVTALKEIERNLIDAREAAEAATQAKSDFLARMSHEIRTPMNAILGMVFLCLQTKLAADQKNYLQKAHSAATNLLSIINDILDFSKIEANRMELESIPFTLSGVVKDIVDVTYQMADKKGLELLFHIDPNIPNALIGDPLRLKQVLINLVSNAIKFTASGDVLVRAVLGHMDGNTAHITLSVTDNGIGMSEEDMSRLFVPFAQVDGSITRKFGGSGLGLVISESIIKAMGGTISVSSQRDMGTTFTCAFPIQCALQALQDQQTIKQLPCKALVVDDNSTAREILREILLGVGSTVDIAKSSFEALNLVEQSINAHTHYDLVFMDWVMPHMDGIICAEKIMEICKYNQHTPIICMMTGYSLETLRTKAHAIGITHCLVKPLTAESVYSFLETHFVNLISGDKIRHRESGPKKLLPLTRKNVRLLLVEDNEDNIEVASILLKRMGCKVTVARNGMEAVEKAETQIFDCILMDMQMPYMDGLEATRAIRALPQDYTHRVPILCMSANALQSHKEKAFAAGMNGYIVKPFDPFALRETLEERLLPMSKGESLEQDDNTSPDDEQQTTPENMETQEQQETLPDSLPGFDLAAGLHNVGNDVGAYLEHLRLFASRYSEIPATLADALQAHDNQEAMRVTHTIKGVAATFGAKALSASAAAVESALRDNQPVSELTEVFYTNLAEALTATASLVKTKPEAPKPSPQGTAKSSRKEVEQLLALLQDVLESDLMGAASVIERLKPLLQGPELEALYAKLYTALRNCDMDAMSATIAEILEVIHK